MGRVSPRDPLLVVLRVLCVCLAACSLAGCVEQMADLQAGSGSVRTALSEPPADGKATVALVSLEGAPATVEAQFRQALAGEVASRAIALTDPAQAHYLIRGYLSAYAADQGVEVAYAYDVFDAADRHRCRRVSDTINVPGDGADPWSAVNAAVLQSLTGRSADDLAAGLAAAPDRSVEPGPVASAPAEAPPAVN